jgi:hypothetical protein
MTALFHQYRAAMGLLSQTNPRRTATARFYISLVSGLVGLLAIVHRTGVEAETKLWITAILTLFSIFLNATWFMMIRSLRHLAKIQRSLLREMEESLPYVCLHFQARVAHGAVFRLVGYRED